MKAGFVQDIDKCIEAAAAPGGPSVALVADAGQAPEGLFILAYTELFRKFGAPDYPSLDGGGDGGVKPGASLLALWDFDYYQLSLSVEEDGGERRVSLQRHVP